MPILIRRAADDDTGTTSIEYALIASLISVAIVVSISGIAPAFNEIWPAIIGALT